MQSEMMKGVRGFLLDAGVAILPAVFGCLFMVLLVFLAGSVYVTFELLLGSGVDNMPALIRYGALVVTAGLIVFCVWWLCKVAPDALAERGLRWQVEKESAAKASEARKRLAERGAYADPARNQAGGNHS